MATVQDETIWASDVKREAVAQGLIGEDGAIEVAAGGFSIEPFVRVGDTLVTWADAQIAQTLQDDYLPIPSVDWTHDALQLRVTGFARGTPESLTVEDRSGIRADLASLRHETQYTRLFRS